MSYSFKKLVRQDTGRHMLDSGGENGRAWQQPLPEEEFILVEVDKERNEVTSYINLHMHLDDSLEIDDELTDKYKCWLESNDEYDTYESFQTWSGKTAGCDVGNTYNHDNDLSQDFLYSVASDDRDWHYDDEALVYISTHNGADIRGGYSSGVICRMKDDRHFLSVEIQWENIDDDSEYSVYELYELTKEIISFDQKTDQLAVRLEDGTIETLTPRS